MSGETDCAKIKGGWPGVFPESFIGCHAEVIDGALYVGFKYNKPGNNEYQIWSEQDMEGDRK